MKELVRAKTTCHLKLEDISLEEDGLVMWSIVIESPEGRKCLQSFMKENSEGRSLLELFEAIEKLRCCEQSILQDVGTEIFFTFISSPAPALHLSKTLIKKLEGFLVADNDHQVFYEVQSEALSKLEECFSEAFLSSRTFLQAKRDLIKSYLDKEASSKRDETPDSPLLNNVNENLYKIAGSP